MKIHKLDSKNHYEIYFEFETVNYFVFLSEKFSKKIIKLSDSSQSPFYIRFYKNNRCYNSIYFCSNSEKIIEKELDFLNYKIKFNIPINLSFIISDFENIKELFETVKYNITETQNYFLKLTMNSVDKTNKEIAATIFLEQFDADIICKFIKPLCEKFKFNNLSIEKFSVGAEDEFNVSLEKSNYKTKSITPNRFKKIEKIIYLLKDSIQKFEINGLSDTVLISFKDYPNFSFTYDDFFDKYYEIYFDFLKILNSDFVNLLYNAIFAQESSLDKVKLLRIIFDKFCTEIKEIENFIKLLNL